jgi:mono/diheme cytochrome c family protein
MSAPFKVLVCWVAIVLALVAVVFYRYDIISGIKRTMGTNSEQPVASATVTPNSQDQSKQAAMPEAAPSSNVAFANGKKLYEEKTCVLCHGATGKADTPTGQAMKATNLTAGKFHNNKDNLEATAYILKVIDEGVAGTAMVSFKAQIPSEQDRKDLADYVHSLSKN